ncbi:MAG: T9SS type A sorting domain-containing protein [Fidelibacterota bacterium]
MKTQSTFTDAGWDFSGETTNGTNDYWTINASLNGGYPHLVWAESVDSSLPVELVSFTAQLRGNTILLSWVTESELENLGFFIERSYQGRSWVEIASYKTDASLRGQGSVSYRSVYSYIDKNIEPGVTYDYRLADVDYKGRVTYHRLSAGSIGLENGGIPADFIVVKNYPNPFNPATTIVWNLSQAANVQVVVYDMQGRRINELVNGYNNAGRHEITWRGLNSQGIPVGAGMYFYSVTAGEYTSVHKMVLMK